VNSYVLDTSNLMPNERYVVSVEAGAMLLTIGRSGSAAAPGLKAAQGYQGSNMNTPGSRERNSVTFGKYTDHGPSFVLEYPTILNSLSLILPSDPMVVGNVAPLTVEIDAINPDKNADIQWVFIPEAGEPIVFNTKADDDGLSATLSSDDLNTLPAGVYTASVSISRKGIVWGSVDAIGKLIVDDGAIKEALIGALEAAGKLVVNDFANEAEWQALIDAIAAAEEVLADNDATVVDLYKALLALEAAIAKVLNDAEFLQLRAAAILKNGLTASQLLLSSNNNATLTLVIDGRTFILATNVNNRNVEGSIMLPDGSGTLVFDIKGNGSNVKTFRII